MTQHGVGQFGPWDSVGLSGLERGVDTAQGSNPALAGLGATRMAGGPLLGLTRGLLQWSLGICCFQKRSSWGCPK